MDDDSFVALTHASGIRSHLWVSSVAAQAGPRMRVLGSVGAYTKYGLDVQEAALRAGARPGPGWGEERAEHWGRLGIDGNARPVRTSQGALPLDIPQSPSAGCQYLFARFARLVRYAAFAATSTKFAFRAA